MTNTASSVTARPADAPSRAPLQRSWIVRLGKCLRPWFTGKRLVFDNSQQHQV